MYRIVDGKPAEMRQSVNLNGRAKEYVQEDFMDMESGVLFVAMRSVTE
jgi:hypothetical protein